MLQFKVKEILLASGHRFPAKWMEKHCGFSKPKAYKIANSKQDSINLHDFSKLCESLNCTPNDFLWWKETPATKIPPSHPCMTQLTPPDVNADWNLIFKKLPPEKVLALHLYALEVLNEKKQ